MVNSRFFIIFLLILALQSFDVLGEDEVKRIDSEIDESSCVCGLNKELLEKLEHLARLGSSTSLSATCLSVSDSHQSETAEKADPNSVNPRHDGESKPSSNDPQVNKDVGGSEAPKEVEHKDSEGGSNENHQKEVKEEPKETANNDGFSGVTYQTKPVFGDHLELKDPQFMISYITKLTAEIQRLETQMSSMIHHQTEQVEPSPSLPMASNTAPPTQTAVVSSPYSSSLVNEDHQDKTKGESRPSTSSTSTSTTTTTITETVHQYQQQHPMESNFLAAIKPGNNEALMKLNQSQKVEPQVMENALQSIIPNLVSSIFSSINKLELQSIQQQNGSNSDGNSNIGSGPDTGKLTSIDGSSIEVPKSDTSDQVLASGEKLFLLWIEHQLKGFHLTASMANYITRNALNLFRRMVRQYIKRLERVGGSLNENARRATQLALSSSQNVTAFLLKNYINFAGGLLQIVGDSMSRVGKQIDSTGGTIAHMSLNPFDIVSNVMESLPNPADYSKYFRAFGKQLMGETLSSSLSNKPNVTQDLADGDKQEVATSTTVEGSKATSQRPTTLLSKTFGALSKTLTSWVG